jgi:hypothetical protein
MAYSVPQAPMQYDAPVLGVPAAGLAPHPPQVTTEPPGVGSTGEVNEDGQTTFG